MDDYQQQSLSHLLRLDIKWVIAPAVSGSPLTALGGCAPRASAALPRRALGQRPG